MEPVRATFALLGLGAALAACGGSGDGASGVPGGPGGPTFQTIDIQPDPGNSGQTTGGGAVFVTLQLNPGDVPANVDFRGQLSFPLTGVPANATITLASLRCSQVNISGNPYGENGTLDVDHIDQGAGLDIADHVVAPLVAVGALSVDATLAVKVLAVTAQVQADRAALRPNSDFRLQFTTAPSVDGNPDSVFVSAVNPGEELVLRVTFTTP